MAYTREQYLEAAAKADAAGDVGSAEELRALAASVEPPTQRARAAAQGATLGFSDEILAALQAPFGEGAIGQNYEAALQGERNALEQYRKDYPVSSTAWEIGGALAPAFLSGGAAAPASATRTAAVLSGLGRGAMGGAKAGAVYGFGTGEGGILNRAAEMGQGAIVGGIGGGIIGSAMGALRGTGSAMTNWVRNKFGDRMAGTVSKEVQRLAEQGGMTPDEIIDGVASGRIMAENRTLESMIRRFYSEGGPAGAEIKRVLSDRPGQTRTAAMEELQKSLGSPGNPLANKRASDEAARRAENIAYESAFKPSGIELPAPDEIVAQMQDIARRAPAALKDAADAARVKYGTNPFFTVAEDGTIEFARAPTLREAETVYRILRDKASEAYQGGKGTIGGAYKELAQDVKGELDIASPALAAARAEAEAVRGARDAFKLGQEAIRRSPDELALLIKDIEKQGPDAVAAFREGMLTSVRAGMSRPSAAPGLMRGLASEDTGPGTALRLALPPGVSASVVQKIENAANAQRAYNKIIEGSQTAQTLMSPGVGGAANVAQDIASGMGGDMMAWARLIGNAANSLRPGLSDAQKLEVARIVLSEDPALVQRALKDDTVMGQIMQNTARAIEKVTRAGTRAAAPGLDLTIMKD